MLRATLRRMSSVLFEEHGANRLVILSRPKALNSLNLEMVETMLPHYRQWQAALPESMTVVMKGAGGKAFCAGGDVVNIVKNEPNGVRAEFFYREYQLDYLVASLRQPHVALWDGIVMGGGVGVSVHGRYRVATENSVFAMPETGIGFFPDVGGSWMLPRLPHKALGLYLGVTGARLKGADVYHSGLATHFVPSAQLAALERELLRSSPGQVAQLLTDAQAGATVPPFSLHEKLPEIDQHFGSGNRTVEGIMASLKQANTPWTNGIADNIVKKLSPSAVKLSLALYHKGAACKHIAEVFALEYNASQRCMETADFAAGVSALLIDKSGQPKWQPDSLAAVSDALVHSHFAPPAHGCSWDKDKPFHAPKL